MSILLILKPLTEMFPKGLKFILTLLGSPNKSQRILLKAKALDTTLNIILWPLLLMLRSTFLLYIIWQVLILVASSEQDSNPGASSSMRNI